MLNLEIINSPYSNHSNSLFTFFKGYLRDKNIYPTTASDYPYTTKKIYKFKITGNTENIIVQVNKDTYLNFDSTDEHTFYLIPKLGRNTILIISQASGNLLKRFSINCYNFLVFIAYGAMKFKQLRNKLQQVLANTYYSDTLVQDLDGNYLPADYNYTRAWAGMLGSTRYSGFTNSEYYGK